MKLKIVITYTGTGERIETDDFFVFEENGIHQVNPDGTAESHWGASVKVEIFIGDNCIFPLPIL